MLFLFMIQRELLCTLSFFLKLNCMVSYGRLSGSGPEKTPGPPVSKLLFLMIRLFHILTLKQFRRCPDKAVRHSLEVAKFEISHLLLRDASLSRAKPAEIVSLSFLRCDALQAGDGPIVQACTALIKPNSQQTSFQRAFSRQLFTRQL